MLVLSKSTGLPTFDRLAFNGVVMFSDFVFLVACALVFVPDVVLLALVCIIC